MMENDSVLIRFDNGYIFKGNELRNVKIIQQIDPISTEIAINTADLTINSQSDIKYSFKENEGFKIYYNGKLLGYFFVETVKRTGKNMWKISGEDYISYMEDKEYLGGWYNDKNAVELLTDIFKTSGVPFDIDDSFSDKVVSGYLPITTCRDALMQVAFSIQAVVDTSNFDIVRVFSLNDTIKQTIPPERIKQGQKFDNYNPIYEVIVSANEYYEPLISDDDMQNYAGITTLYSGRKQGEGENIFVKFPSPHTYLKTRYADIVESDVNYAIINAPISSSLLGGWSIDNSLISKSITNNNFPEGADKKVIRIDNGTLVSKNNVGDVLEKCYNYLVNTDSATMEIVEGKYVTGGEYIRYGDVKFGNAKFGGKTEKIVTYDEPINVGEVITVSTEYLGEITGRVIKQTFDLTDGITIKNVVLKQRSVSNG